jgi:DNA-binding protein WhiA
MMELENIKILKEVRNNVNRQVNCETANITKTVSAAHKQIEDIKQLKMSGNFDKLTPALREIAELRLAHPEASLSELASMVGDGISRSGINHRLKKIATIADTYH